MKVCGQPEIPFLCVCSGGTLLICILHALLLSWDCLCLELQLGPLLSVIETQVVLSSV